MRRSIAGVVSALFLFLNVSFCAAAEEYKPVVKLGDDRLLSDYHQWIDGKNIGLVTNQTGVNSQGQSMIQVLAGYPNASLKALYAPEHGIDGKTKAGDYVASYTDPNLNIPVYSLYGDTRMPTKEMLDSIDVLVFDIQDIGARSYTYNSTLDYCMIAAQKYNKSIVVLDRPNPLGGQLVDGPVLEDPLKSFVGIDNLPMAHGMTVGELAQFFNRKIGADVHVVPMQGYTRQMLFSDTGLKWVQTSPYIPTFQAALDYMATGMGEGTNIYQDDYFGWIGGKGIQSDQYADLLNKAQLPGVQFTPQDREDAGGVKLTIVDPKQFNPVRTGIYTLSLAHRLNHFDVPTSKDGKVVMFDKIMGNSLIGQQLSQDVPPEEMEKGYQDAVKKFKEDRKPYLLYGDGAAMATTATTAPTPTPTPVSLEQEKPKTQETVKSSFDGGIFKHNQSYIPFSPVLKQLGFQVSWDSQTQQVTAKKKDWRVLIDTKENPIKVTVNDQIMGSEINPFLRQGVTYIPAFFITYLVAGTTVDRGDTIRISTPDQQIDVTYTIEKDPPKRTGKMVYLTFDDGPSPITPEILDILKENDVKATFFVIGQNVKAHPDILKREYEEGHAIGNHTYSHNYYSIYQNVPAFFQDLNRGEQEIEKVTGEDTDIVRLPGGSNNTVSKHAQDGNYTWIMKDIVKELKDQGYSYFDWNASTGDAETNSYTPNSAFQHVKDSVGDGSKNEIILLAHDAASKENTVKALPRIIQYLKDEGYSFGTLDHTVPTIAFLK